MTGTPFLVFPLQGPNFGGKCTQTVSTSLDGGMLDSWATRSRNLAPRVVS